MPVPPIESFCRNEKSVAPIAEIAVSKTCPSCGYQPIGPYTDNCPICAEPVRNVRSDGARSMWLGGSPPWSSWLLRGTGIFMLCVAGCCGLGMWRMGTALQDVQKAALEMQAKMEAERKARTVVVAAADLLKDFQDDPAEANRKYKGKYLELSGIVERTGKGVGGPAFVILHAGDEQAPIKIECFFDFTDEDDDTRNKRLPNGKAITVRGEYAGRVSHVQVRSCVLVQ